MERKQFFLEDLIGPIDGWDKGELWNGWNCPYFEFSDANVLVEEWNNKNLGSASYNEEEDYFRFLSNGEEDIFPSITISGTKLYPIGTFCWVWQILY